MIIHVRRRTFLRFGFTVVDIFVAYPVGRREKRADIRHFNACPIFRNVSSIFSNINSKTLSLRPFNDPIDIVVRIQNSNLKITHRRVMCNVNRTANVEDSSPERLRFLHEQHWLRTTDEKETGGFFFF